VAALVYNAPVGTSGTTNGLDDLDETMELQAIIQREVGDVCSDGVLDYSRTYAWEFRYDGPRQRYLRREVHPGDFQMLSEEWSDYDDDSVYADFVLDSGVTGGAHSVRDYLTAEAHADSSTHGVWDGQAYYHGNQIGSTRVMTDGTPQVVRSYVYDAFGNVYDTSGTATTRYRYAGAWGYQSHDDFPFLHVGARYYDPETGRFLQRDPIGIRGGLNVYEYVFSDPTHSIDPLGLGFWDGNNFFHDRVARWFWMNRYNPAKKRLAKMGNAEAAAWVCVYTAVGTPIVYYGGKYAVRWLNRGQYRIGKSGPFKGNYYFSYRSPKVPHRDIFRIPDWFRWKVW